MWYVVCIGDGCGGHCCTTAHPSLVADILSVEERGRTEMGQQFCMGAGHASHSMAGSHDVALLEVTIDLANGIYLRERMQRDAVQVAHRCRCVHGMHGCGATQHTAWCEYHSAPSHLAWRRSGRLPCGTGSLGAGVAAGLGSTSVFRDTSCWRPAVALSSALGLVSRTAATRTDRALLSTAIGSVARLVLCRWVAAAKTRHEGKCCNA